MTLKVLSVTLKEKFVTFWFCSNHSPCSSHLSIMDHELNWIAKIVVFGWYTSCVYFLLLFPFRITVQSFIHPKMNMTLCNAQNLNKLKIIWINRIWRRQGADNFAIDFRLLKNMASLRSEEWDGTQQRIVRPSTIKTIIIHAVKIKTKMYRSLLSISNDVLTITYESN